MRSVPCFTEYDVLHTSKSGNSTTLKFRYYLSDVQLPSDNIERTRQQKHDRIPAVISGLASFKEHQINIHNLLKNVLAYYEKLKAIENHRYRSWEHCYSFFVKNRNAEDDETIDLMCLHLSNYLASWGMFRGAAFLLQKDYKVHNDVVRLLLEQRFDVLWNLNIKHSLNDPLSVKRIFELSREIVGVYRAKTKGRIPSDTLITKILLGIRMCPGI